MILGIAGLPLLVLTWALALPLSIAAVVLGFIGRKKEPAGRAFALTGIITGFVGLLIALAIVVFLVFFFAIAIGSASSGYNYG